MRQFLFGLLCAALVWWGYSAWAPAKSGEVNAAVVPDPMLKGSPVLEMIRSDKDIQKPAPQASEAPQAPTVADATLSGPDLEALVAVARKGDEAGVSSVWSRLADARTPGASRAALLEAMSTHRVDEAGAALALLGTNNAFLHSAEGLAVGKRALELAAALPAEASAMALTQLVEKCMRGDIAKSDTGAVAFVDRAAIELRRQADRTLCDPSNVARSRSYTVQPGDSLGAIAARFRREKIMVDYGTLMVLNRIHNAKTLRPGQKLKIPLEPVKTVVEKRSFLMAVYVGDVILRLYWVGHGADDKTPVATFTVAEVMENPQWDAPDGGHYPPGHPKNILGKWFVKLKHDSHQGFGIHGTVQPETIGTMASMGCVRLRDADIQDYAGLVPRGSLVEVRDSK